MEEEVQSVRWDYHSNHLQTMFSLQMDRGRFCDVTLACQGGQLLKAHRSVLCATSGYFDTVLSNSTLGKDIIIVLKDCDYEEVKLLLDFMYKGEISIKTEQFPSLQNTARILQVVGLSEARVSFDDQYYSKPPLQTAQTLNMNEFEENLPTPSRRKRRRTATVNHDLPKILSVQGGSAGIITDPFDDVSAVFLQQPDLSDDDCIEVKDDDQWDQFTAEIDGNDDNILGDQNLGSDFEAGTSLIDYKSDSGLMSAPQVAFWSAIESCLQAEIPAIIKHILRKSGYDNPIIMKGLSQNNIEEIESYINDLYSWPEHVIHITIDMEDTYKTQDMFKFTLGDQKILLQIASITNSEKFNKEYALILKRENKYIQKQQIRAIENDSDDNNKEVAAVLKKQLCEKIFNFIYGKNGFSEEIPQDSINVDLIENFTVSAVTSDDLPSANGEFNRKYDCRFRCPAKNCNLTFKCFYKQYMSTQTNQGKGRAVWRKPAWFYQNYVSHFSKCHINK